MGAARAGKGPGDGEMNRLLMGASERWKFCREEGHPGRNGSAMGPGEPL